MSLILGSYEVIEKIGEGAFGTVFKGVHRILGRKAALKIVKLNGEAGEDSLVDYFVREARILAGLNHEYIVQIYDIFDTEHGPCIAMEFIDGVNLQDLHYEKLTKAELSRFLAQSLKGLQEAHRSGIVHRDLKPSNLILDKQKNRIIIVDFGISFGFKQDHLETSFERVAGTLLFMSPEQIRGQQLDIRTDLWSLGVIGYYLLTRKYPFYGNNAYEISTAICQGEFLPPSSHVADVPSWFENMVSKLLQPDLNKRYQTCQEVLNDLPIKLDQRRFSKARDLNPEELLDGIIQVLPGKEIKINREHAIRLAANSIGINRVGRQIRHEYLKAIQRGIKRSLLILDEENNLFKL